MAAPHPAAFAFAKDSSFIFFQSRPHRPVLPRDPPRQRPWLTCGLHPRRLSLLLQIFFLILSLSFTAVAHMRPSSTAPTFA
jgi:hypothetical protein